MIHEYAIEPELAVTWGQDRFEYRYYCEQFGIGTPRMMAEFPKLKNWRKQFKEAAARADQTNELPRITALFKLLTERLIHREGFEYDGTLSWLENAESENTRQAFHAILAQTNPRQRANVMTSNSVHNSPLWKVKKQDCCSRTASDMAALVRAMLINCSEVHFVDPHFGSENVRFRRPLEAFLQIISANRNCRPVIERIVIHTSDKADYTFFRQSCEDHLKSKMPGDLIITLQRWKEREGGEKLHNRYILSDIGGLKVDPGLDDGNPGGSFEAMLLERNLYEKQWNDFISNPAFEKAEAPIVISAAKGKK